jgi:Excreted virulence factor EspC, type VII ESX diderm
VSDLRVRTALLRNTAASLSELCDELAGLEERRDQVRSAWGSHDVADTLDSFVDNWDDNRRRIADSMTSLQRMAEATAEEFERVEADLTGSFDR